MVGRTFWPSDVTPVNVMLHSKRDFTNIIKVTDQLDLKQGDYLELLGQV